MKKVIKAKSKGRKFSIEWNELGQPIGENRAMFISYIGVVTRSHVPISLDHWKKVPN